MVGEGMLWAETECLQDTYIEQKKDIEFEYL